jgi:hypothetical protein
VPESTHLCSDVLKVVVSNINRSDVSAIRLIVLCQRPTLKRTAQFADSALPQRNLQSSHFKFSKSSSMRAAERIVTVTMSHHSLFAFPHHLRRSCRRPAGSTWLYAFQMVCFTFSYTHPPFDPVSASLGASGALSMN